MIVSTVTVNLSALRTSFCVEEVLLAEPAYSFLSSIESVAASLPFVASDIVMVLVEPSALVPVNV